MIKENKGKLIITSLIILIPILMGIIIWKKLPDQIPTHWNAAGEIDGWSSKAFTVFVFPGLLFAIHWICILASCADPKRHNYSSKMLNIVLWICPVLSVLLMTIVYGTALGMAFKVDKIMLLLVGIMFLIIGNYLPKCKQNYTMGIKLPWTLNDEENWNYTHRLAGRIWVATGFVTMACVLIPGNIMFVVFIIVMTVSVIIPTICSYLFYKKKSR